MVGHGYSVETPTTTDNVFKRNLAVVNHIAHFSQAILATQGENQASNFWITAARNTFIGNEAAGSAGSGFWYDNTSDSPTVFEDNTAYASASRSTDLDFVRESGLLVVVEADVTLEFGKTLLFNNSMGLWPTEQGHQIYKDFTIANNGVTVETAGAGRATFRNPLFYRSSLLTQYGGTVDFDSPTFVDVSGGIYSSNDIFVPWMADYRFKNVKFVGGAGKGGNLGMPSHCVVEALDDSFLPKGFYVPAEFPHLATSAMTLEVLDSEGEVFAYRGAKRLAYGNFRVLTSPDGFEQRGSQLDGFLSSMVRSDGLEFESFEGATHIIGNEEGLSYRMVTGPERDRFAVVIDLHGGIYQVSGPVMVEVEVPSKAPRQGRWKAARIGEGLNLEDDPVTPMTAAGSLNAFRANPDSYYFDAAEQRLHVWARSDRVLLIDR